MDCRIKSGHDPRATEMTSLHQSGAMIASYQILDLASDSHP
ncbi:MAG TPA: hypothetical protein VN809_05605 [Telmatospirillum sp.]|nr:hypothetical protein [Telmatospirillum sp.]